MQLDRKSVAYASSTLAASMMQSVFSFYYINVYLQRFHVARGWFLAAQILFMVWNAINDPLFAYVQDNYRFWLVKSRRHSILYGAPLLAFAFAIVWFPWGDYHADGDWLVGVQLMVSLCLYDAAYTFVLLAQSALFHDLSPSQEDRVKLMRYSQVASAIGSSSVFFCALISENLEVYWAFECACVLVALLSLGFLTYTGLNATTAYDDIANGDAKSPLVEATPDMPKVRRRRKSVMDQTFAIIRQPNFVCFVIMNFLHIYYATFIANFTGVICDQVVPADYLSSTSRSVFYGALFLLPQVTLVMGSSFVTWIGYYRIIRITFAAKAVLGLWLLYVGPEPWAVIIFFLCISTASAGAYPLFNLCLSDIIDEDMSKNRRRLPQSSMVFGANALITKPAVSLAPMTSVAILGYFGYQHAQTTGELSMTVADPQVSDAMFYLAAITPVVIGTLQFAVWSGYTLRNTHITARSLTDV